MAKNTPDTATQETKATVSIPTTPEELQALIDRAKEEAYQKGADEATKQSEQIIADLEAKVALSSNNPLAFPRLTRDGKVYQLPFLHSFSVSDDSKVIMFNPEDFVSDEEAKKKFNKTAKEVIEYLFDIAEDLFEEVNS